MNPYALQAQIMQIQNSMMASNYQALIRSIDYRSQLSWGTQDACCDAYFIRDVPDSIRCCTLGMGSGF